MSKVMVFTHINAPKEGYNCEWYSRGGKITVRNEQEIADCSPERVSDLAHTDLHKYHCIKFKELRNE